MYHFDERPGTHFSEKFEIYLPKIRDSEYAVLVGRNNCGKSFLLKQLTRHWGENTSYLGPARYQNFHILGAYAPNKNYKQQKWQQFLQQSSDAHQNIDNSPVNLQQAIAELTDNQRDNLKEIMMLILGVDIDIRHTIENNSMSQKYISCDGHNISYTSSGFRLITTLVTSLLNEDYDTFLVDEPELGISPEAQGVLADFLFDREHRKHFFPHIKTLVFATHSTIFLDRNNINNNYIVEKNGDEISVLQTNSQSTFNNIHFFLLGNRFETLLLPSAIVLVEGKSDYKFIDRVLTQKYPNHQISVIPANSDSRIKEIMNFAKGIFVDIQKSPYRDRIFVVLDSIHSATLPNELEKMGVPKEHVIVWPQNGIEFFYPPTIINKIFGSGPELVINGDTISRNQISYTKADLAEKVISNLDVNTVMHDDFSQLFLARLEEKL